MSKIFITALGFVSLTSTSFVALVHANGDPSAVDGFVTSEQIIPYSKSYLERSQALVDNKMEVFNIANLYNNAQAPAPLETTLVITPENVFQCMDRDGNLTISTDRELVLTGYFEFSNLKIQAPIVTFGSFTMLETTGNIFLDTTFFGFPIPQPSEWSFFSGNFSSEAQIGSQISISSTFSSFGGEFAMIESALLIEGVLITDEKSQESIQAVDLWRADQRRMQDLRMDPLEKDKELSKKPKKRR